MFINQSRNISLQSLKIERGKLASKYIFSLKIYNKFNLCNIEKEKKIFWHFRILKCVTKRECVTSKVRKDPKGNSTNFSNIDIVNNITMFQI